MRATVFGLARGDLRAAGLTRGDLRAAGLALRALLAQKRGMANRSSLQPSCRPAQPPRTGRYALLGLILICVVVEVALQGADFGLWGNARWRGLSYQYGGFWAGLLWDWRPNYRGQAVVMFFSYAALHAGAGHLIGNMLGLAWLGDLTQERCGARGLLVLYGLSALGGALAFGGLSSSPAPMIGASGAIFGLAGAWTVWDWQDSRNDPDARASHLISPQLISPQFIKRGLRPLAVVLGLAGLNAAVWVLQDGNLAWETHLGGFATGALLALWGGYIVNAHAS